MSNSFGKYRYGHQDENSVDILPMEEETGPDIFLYITVGFALIALGLLVANFLRSKEAVAAPVMQTSQQSDPMDEVIAYLSPSSGAPAQDSLTKYDRTVEVMNGCGRGYKAVVESYQTNNVARYKSLQAVIEQGQNNQGLRTADAETFKLDMTISRDNTQLASLGNVTQIQTNSNDDVLRRKLSKDECGRLEARIQQGMQNI